MKTDKPTKEVMLMGGPSEGRIVNVLLGTSTLYTETKAATGMSHKYVDAEDEMTFNYAGEVKEGA